jgi:hypothetical protein
MTQRARSLARRCAVGAVVLFTAAGVVGCGSDSGPSPIPPRPGRTTLVQGSFSVTSIQEAVLSGQPRNVFQVTFDVPATGLVEGTVDWMSRANAFGLTAYVGSCSEAQYLAGQCITAGPAIEPTTVKPATLSMRDVPPGRYTFLFVNYGQTAEAGTYSVTLSR